MGGGFFFIGEFLHFLKLKNMILIHTKDFFFQNNGNNSLDFKKQWNQIIRFFQHAQTCNRNLKGFKTFFLLSCLVYSQFSLILLVDDHQFAYFKILKKRKQYKAYQIYKKKKRKKKSLNILQLIQISKKINFHVASHSMLHLSLLHILLLYVT